MPRLILLEPDFSWIILGALAHSIVLVAKCQVPQIVWMTAASPLFTQTQLWRWQQLPWAGTGAGTQVLSKLQCPVPGAACHGCLNTKKGKQGSSLFEKNFFYGNIVCTTNFSDKNYPQPHTFNITIFDFYHRLNSFMSFIQVQPK